MPLVISPHLDDAVLSCGHWLATHPGSLVLTLFAGAPRDPSRRLGWDEQCGFASAGEAIAARRREDAQALALLEARPRWLDFTDSQYGESASPDTLAAALREAIAEARPDTVLYPMGLFHSDHRLAHDAAVAALRGLKKDDAGTGIAVTALAYEDVPYRGIPGVLQQRLAELAAAGWQATPAAAPGRQGADGADAAGLAARKARAVQEYPSQLRAFGPGGLPDAALPERLWRLDPAPSGEEGEGKGEGTR